MISGKNILLNRLLLQMMAVNILIGLIQPCNQFADSALTGNGLGTPALEAYSIFLPVGSFVLAMSSFFTIGTQISCSHLLGAGKGKEAKDHVRTAFLCAAVFSVLLAFVLYFFPDTAAAVLGAKGAEQIRAVGSYFQAYAVGIPAIFLMNIMMSLLLLEGRKKIAVILSLCILIINVSGDLLNLHVFKKGLSGMALATSASYIVVFLVLLLYFLFRSKMFRFSLTRFRRAEFVQIVKNGLPSLTYFGSLVIRTAFFNYLIITKFEGRVLAIMVVVNSFTSMVDAAIGGSGDAVLLLGGVLYGEKNVKDLRDMLKKALLYSSILLLVITVISIAAAVPIAALFSNGKDPAFIQEAANAVVLTSLCFVPDVMACILKKLIQAVGRAKYTSISNVICNVVFVGLGALILTQFMGSDGIFLSFLVCYVLTLCMHVVYAKVLSRRSGRKGFDILLYLPETYEVSDSDIWGVGVVDMNGCMEASREILRLCKERSVDEKRCIFLSLFEEEVVKNIIEHGFRRKKKNHIMIRLVFLKDRITLNILDDCPYFDPQSYYDQLQESNERIKGFGIRIVMRMAKKASYTNSFRLNHLMIEI